MNPGNIENALRARFIAAIPGSVGKTAFENQPYDPKGNEKWYAFHFMPNEPDIVTLGLDGQDMFTGIAQIDLHVPLGSGKDTFAEFLAIIRAAFTPSVPLIYESTIVNIRSCGQIPGGQAKNSYRFSVSIGWEARMNRGDSLALVQAAYSPEDDIVAW